MKPSHKNIQFYWLAIFILFPLYITIINYFKFNGLYGQDAHEYLRMAKEIAGNIRSDSNQKQYLFPILYPLIIGLLGNIIPIIWAPQLINLTIGFLAYISFCKLLNLRYPNGTMRQRYCFLFFCCSPFFIRAQIVGMSDILAMTFIILSWLHLEHYKQTLRPKHFLLSIAFIILATQTRYASLFMALPLFSKTLFDEVKRRPKMSIYIIAAIVLALTPSIYLSQLSINYFVHHPWISAWRINNIFENNFINQEGAFNYQCINIFYSLSAFVHPGLVFSGTILFYQMIKKHKVELNIYTITLLVYIIYLSGIPYQNLRYLLPTLPLVLLMYYNSYEDTLQYITSKKLKLFLFILVVVIQFGLAVRSINPLYQLEKEEKNIATKMLKYENEDVLTFGITSALKTYVPSIKVYDLWYDQSNRMISGKLILYNPNKFKAQYAGTNPGIQFKKLQNNLTTIDNFNNGWTLYRIK